VAIFSFLRPARVDFLVLRLSGLGNILSFSLINNFDDQYSGFITFAMLCLPFQDVGKYINQLVPPVLSCFMDQDNKVRYYACESLYNISKAARGLTLNFFNDLFDELCKVRKSL
jgi:vacuole morphology and inheritance protein 14